MEGCLVGLCRLNRMQIPGQRPDRVRPSVPACSKLHAAEAAARRQPLLVRVRKQAAHAMDSWKAYFAQPILPSSLTFVLLFFNVVLAPGGWICCALLSLC